MRFTVVLFDLDGTLIDSGAMILASFRHATRTVLAREIPDEALLAHVGGATLDEQMRALDPARVDDLVASYREHNGPLHDELQPCVGVVEVLERLHDEGRRRVGRGRVGWDPLAREARGLRAGPPRRQPGGAPWRPLRSRRAPKSSA